MDENGKTVSDRKIYSADIEPTRSGDHMVVVNGQAAARFDSIQKALAAREFMLEVEVTGGQER